MHFDPHQPELANIALTHTHPKKMPTTGYTTNQKSGCSWLGQQRGRNFIGWKRTRNTKGKGRGKEGSRFSSLGRFCFLLFGLLLCIGRIPIVSYLFEWERYATSRCLRSKQARMRVCVCMYQLSWDQLCCSFCCLWWPCRPIHYPGTL